MEILSKTHIKFKSSPDFFEKEKSGNKTHIIRRLSNDEKEFISDNEPLYITVCNSATKESFTRRIQEISNWYGATIIIWESIDLDTTSYIQKTL